MRHQERIYLTSWNDIIGRLNVNIQTDNIQQCLDQFLGDCFLALNAIRENPLAQDQNGNYQLMNLATSAMLALYAARQMIHLGNGVQTKLKL